MKAIRIENVRSLKDTGWVPLAPLTLLVGQNSSGKSTFLRTFPLMKQSIRTRTDGPMLWAGDVDFGSFADTVSRIDGQEAKKPCEAEAIRFNFRIPISATRLLIGNKAMRRQWGEQNIEYSLEIRSLKQDLRGDYVSRLTVQIANSTFDFEFDPKSPKKSTVKVNGKEVQTILHPDDNSSQHTFRARFSLSTSMFDFCLPPIALSTDVEKRYMPMLDKEWDEDDEDDNEEKAAFSNSFMRFAIYTGSLLCYFESVQAGLDSLQITTKDTGIRYSYGSDAYSKFREKYESLSSEERERDGLIFQLLYFYYSVFDDIEEYLSRYYSQVHYIEPVRATAQRYYRVNNVSVDEVDSQGKNVALFLNNIPKKKAEEFRKWTRENFGFEVRTGAVAGGHISVEISTGANGRTANLADTGFGYSQLLPIIIQLWDLSTREIDNRRRFFRSQALASTPMVIAIEQPELHLHAQLQGKLVHALIAAIKSSPKKQFQFILETHSQTIVNCVGKAIALGKLSPDDVSLVLFNKTIEEPYTEVRTTGFDEDGYPSSWPMGFFVSEEE